MIRNVVLRMMWLFMMAIFAVTVSGCGKEALIKARENKWIEARQWQTSLPEPGADYGAYPENYQQIIKNYMYKIDGWDRETIYGDFTQPKPDFSTNVQGWDDYEKLTRIVRYGYVVCVPVNEKDTYGRYYGSVDDFTAGYYYLIRNGHVDSQGEWNKGEECHGRRGVQMPGDGEGKG
ncbi:MAG: hypothetical protein LBV44_10190 [Methylobacillus sp.]|nr:hypothetical protein [Methylobacillus sp.]